MDDLFTLRLATPADLAQMDDLLTRSYPRLLAADYPPSVRVLAMPLITRARPQLLASRRYYVVEGAEGRLLSAGGYSLAAPGPDGAVTAQGAGSGHIRHFVTDPDATRQGLARRIMEQILSAARGEGVGRMECLSTRTAVPFYSAMGFVAGAEVAVPLAPGITFPAVQMQCSLPAK